MSSQRPQAISGVSAGKEALILTVYPSIAATSLGRSLGVIYDSIPSTVGGIKLSHLLFVLPTAPLAVLIYGFLKVSGAVYSLTNRSIQKRTSLGNRLIREIPLTSIDEVVIRQQPGQAFYPAADINLVNAAGQKLMTLVGVPRADVFRQSILEARNAHRQVASSLATINARKPVTAA